MVEADDFDEVGGQTPVFCKQAAAVTVRESQSFC